jgi:hypothetical protein
LPAQFRGHPRGRNQQQPATPEHLAASCDDDRERRGKERQVGNQHTRDQRANHDALPAERRHRLRDPVQRAAEVHRTGDDPQGERAPAIRAGRRDDERCQGNPGECRLAEFRKAEGEQRAREKG